MVSPKFPPFLFGKSFSTGMERGGGRGGSRDTIPKCNHWVHRGHGVLSIRTWCPETPPDQVKAGKRKESPVTGADDKADSIFIPGGDQKRDPGHVRLGLDFENKSLFVSTPGRSVLHSLVLFHYNNPHLQWEPALPNRDRDLQPQTLQEGIMAREDDYKKAAELARAELASRDPRRLAECGGAEVSTEGGSDRLRLAFLGKPVQVFWPEVSLSRTDSDEDIPIQQQVLLLHYLQGAWRSGGPAPAEDWVGFQDVPDGRFYSDAFQRRAKLPLLRAFGGRPEALETLARKAYGAEPAGLGDASASVAALPRIRVALVIWGGDEEFPADGNILFDRNTNAYLPAEDMAWLAGMIVYPLMGMAAGMDKD